MGRILKYNMLMRFILFVLMLVFLGKEACCQNFSFVVQPLRPKEEDAFFAQSAETRSQKHCMATRAGKIVIVSGAVVTILGITYMLTPYAKTQDDLYGDSYKSATNLSIGGLSLIVAGGLVYLMGKDYESRHIEFISSTSRGNGIGIAWKF